jgi:hypothetical protein
VKLAIVVVCKAKVKFAIVVFAVVMLAFVRAVVMMFALVVVVFNNQEEAIEYSLETVILEAFEIPLKTSIHKTDDFIEVDMSMVVRTIKALTGGV